MPGLLDRPSDESLRLLQVVADGFAANGENWPVWQYVMHCLDTAGVNPEETLQNLPTWQHRYRPVSNEWSGIPEPDTRIALTVHGMYHADRPATNRLVEVFLTTLRLAVERYRGMTPQPDRAVPVAVQAQQVVDAVKRQLGWSVWPTAPELYSLLRREPATRLGFTGSEEAWTWDLARPRLQPFQAVTGAEDYLAALEEVVAIPVTVQARPLPPLALPEAFDHLDLAWRVVTRKPILRLRRATNCATLTQPVASGDEFSSRCSALADLLSLFDLPSVPGDKDAKSLERLREQLKGLLDNAAERALDAVSVLQAIIDLRAGYQHSGKDTINRIKRARGQLGLTGHGSDWAGMWERLRDVAVEALTTIREEVETLIEE